MPISTPNVNWNCHRLVAWLAPISPAPSSTEPDKTTMRVPNRSDSAPQKNAASPIARKSIVAAADTPLRDQPMSCEIGCRNTASDSIDAERRRRSSARRRRRRPSRSEDPDGLLMRFPALLVLYCVSGRMVAYPPPSGNAVAEQPVSLSEIMQPCVSVRLERSCDAANVSLRATILGRSFSRARDAAICARVQLRAGQVSCRTRSLPAMAVRFAEFHTFVWREATQKR